MFYLNIIAYFVVLSIILSFFNNRQHPFYGIYRYIFKNIKEKKQYVEDQVKDMWIYGFIRK